jgi:hypothetical protein
LKNGGSLKSPCLCIPAEAALRNGRTDGGAEEILRGGQIGRALDGMGHLRRLCTSPPRGAKRTSDLVPLVRLVRFKLSRPKSPAAQTEELAGGAGGRAGSGWGAAICVEVQRRPADGGAGGNALGCSCSKRDILLFLNF